MRTVDWLAVSLASPVYVAVSEWDAAERFEVVKVATPLFSVPVPRIVVPSLKVTVPVAVEGETVAVNVTAAPDVAGFGEDARTVVVGALLTTWLTEDDVLVR